MGTLGPRTGVTSHKVLRKPVVKAVFNPGLWDTRTPFSVSIWAEELGRVE